MNSLKVSIIGAGNVGFHLGKSLSENGVTIDQVYSRSLDNVLKNLSVFNFEAIDSIQKLNNSADIYIIAVPDDAIKEIVSQITFQDKFIVHTSGSVSIDVFKNSPISNFGIFYPLQSFSKNKEMDLSEVPFCLEANSSKNLLKLRVLAKCISSYIYDISSQQREILHLAAVFANNFSNQMYQIAEEITETNKIPFEILKPLIKETANKIETLSPNQAQTGPAKRKDKKTIEKHLTLLNDNVELQNIYKLITNRISSKK